MTFDDVWLELLIQVPELAIRRHVALSTPGLRRSLEAMFDCGVREGVRRADALDVPDTSCPCGPECAECVSRAATYFGVRS